MSTPRRDSRGCEAEPVDPTVVVAIVGVNEKGFRKEDRVPNDDPPVCVFAPVLFVSVTIELGDDRRDEIHIHPGGQGFWIARMIRRLGGRPVLCAPLGGEAGHLLRVVIPDSDIDLAAIEIASRTPSYVHDRRSGKRKIVAQAMSPMLDRHEVDDVYTTVLDKALATGVCVMTSRVDDTFPPDVYRRLASDLTSHDVRVVADFHGADLDVFLEGGPIDVLKVSDEELLADGAVDDLEEATLLEAIGRITRRGVRAVVVSRASRPALARFGSDTYSVRPPRIEEVDGRGAGDSMTAALAVAVAQGRPSEEALRLACAAGAANVARRGLASAGSDLIAQLVERVEVERLREVTT